MCRDPGKPSQPGSCNQALKVNHCKALLIILNVNSTIEVLELFLTITLELKKKEKKEF